VMTGFSFPAFYFGLEFIADEIRIHMYFFRVVIEIYVSVACGECPAVDHFFTVSRAAFVDYRK